MTTIPASIKDTLDANWSVPTGGTEPTYYLGDSQQPTTLLGIDAVFIDSKTLYTTTKQLNDTYSNKVHTIDLLVNGITADRLKEITDEVVRILNSTAITGIHEQKATNVRSVSDRVKSLSHRAMVTVTMKEIMVDSATAYGSGSASTFAVDELTVNTSIAGSPTAALGATTVTGNIAVSGTVDAVDIAALKSQHDEANMIGSANAAWIPFVFEVTLDGAADIGGSSLRLANQGANDSYWLFVLPIPTNKGTLKLHIADIRLDVMLADATDYVDLLLVQAVSNAGTTEIVNDGTDRQAQGQYTYAVTPDIDVSAHSLVRGRILTVQTTTDELILTGLFASCYYDT